MSSYWMASTRRNRKPKINSWGSRHWRQKLARSYRSIPLRTYIGVLGMPNPNDLPAYLKSTLDLLRSGKRMVICQGGRRWGVRCFKEGEYRYE